MCASLDALESLKEEVLNTAKAGYREGLSRAQAAT